MSRSKTSAVIVVTSFIAIFTMNSVALAITVSVCPNMKDFGKKIKTTETFIYTNTSPNMGELWEPPAAGFFYRKGGGGAFNQVAAAKECTNKRIVPGEDCEVKIEFAPPNKEEYEAEILKMNPAKQVLLKGMG